MSALLHIMAYELRRQGTRRAYLFMSIGIPLIVILLFHGFQLYSQMKPASTNNAADLAALNAKISDSQHPMGIIDQAGILLDPEKNGGLKPYQDVQEADAAVRNNKIGGYYLLKPDYMETGQVSMYFESFSIGSLDSNVLNRLIVKSLLANKNINSSIISRLQSKLSITPHTIDSSGGAKQSNNVGNAYFLAYVFSMTLLFSAFTTSGYLMRSIVEEKETRMVEILLSSVRPFDLLAGKIIALGLLGLAQMLFWGAALFYLIKQLPSVSPELLGLTSPSNGQLVILIIYFLLGYMLLATVYASVGALATNMREGPQLAAFITVPMALPIYALQLIATSPSGPVAVALSLFPVTAPLTMVSRIAISDVPPLELAVSMGLLVLTIFFTMWLASRLFRVNTLLSGQMPKLKDLPRLVRERI